LAILRGGSAPQSSPIDYAALYAAVLLCPFFKKWLMSFNDAETYEVAADNRWHFASQGFLNTHSVQSKTG
jgi:hypothetical protein